MGRFQAFRFVIQHVKQDGMKVIASTGLDDRVQFLKELSADVAFNYKTTMTSKSWPRKTPLMCTSTLPEQSTVFLIQGAATGIT